MKYSLKIISGRSSGEEFQLTDGQNLVGRSRSAHIRVFNEDVSGKHFILEVSENSVQLKNLSHYGTLVDGVMIHDAVELKPGQHITAGASLVFLLTGTDNTEAEAANQTEISQTEATGITKFVSDTANQTEISQTEATGVTKFVSDTANQTEISQTEATGVTKFVSDTANQTEISQTEATGVTKFVSDTANQTEISQTEATGVTRFAADLPDETAAGQTGNTTRNDTVAGTGNGTQVRITKIPTSGGNITQNRDETAAGPGDQTEIPMDETADGNQFTQTNTVISTVGGGFYEEAGTDDSKSEGNETQAVQTRMASLDEMNFIKKQIKRKQQSRLFLKFLVFVVVGVLLAVVWMIKAPQEEQVLSWPHDRTGDLTVFYPAWGGRSKGGFDLYYPQWKHNKVTDAGDVITINSWLGIKGNVPLNLMLKREGSLAHVYEKRTDALKSALKRLLETPNEVYNFEGNSTPSFYGPDDAFFENGIMYDKISYQRDKGISWYGELYFFRHGRYDYILRIEVPASEKHRAISILNTDTFLSFSPVFIRTHWEGSDKYAKGNLDRMLLGVRDELQNHNSPMLYAKLELSIKSILAQATYNGQKKIIQEAMDLLGVLRNKQQEFYKEHRLQWLSANIDNNTAEKQKIKNECEAVFSISGDKRRYDILRDIWE